MSTEQLIPEAARAMIGKEGEPVTGEVHEKEIRRFCYTVGDLNPIYLEGETDEGSAAQYKVAPPMFYDIPNAGQVPLDQLKEDGLPAGGKGLPLNVTRSMAGGKELEFFASIRPGDRITRVGKFVEMYEKKGRSGQLAFTVFENRYTNQDGDLVVIERVTGIYR